MAGMRDRLIHDFFGVDQDLVWDVVQKKIPTLRSQIQRIVDTIWRRIGADNVIRQMGHQHCLSTPSLLSFSTAFRATFSR